MAAMQHRSFDPSELLCSGIEDRQARQCDRLIDCVDDQQLVLDVVLAVVSADNLGFVDWTDQDCGRPATLVLGWLAVGSEREGEYYSYKNKGALFAISSAVCFAPAGAVFWLVNQCDTLDPRLCMLWSDFAVAHKV